MQMQMRSKKAISRRMLTWILVLGGVCLISGISIGSVIGFSPMISFNPGIPLRFDAYTYNSSFDTQFGSCQFDYSASALNRTHAINFTWVRQDFDWNYIEHENNTWNFTKYDQIVQTANANNLYLLVLFWINVPWAKPSNATGFYDFRKVTNIADWLEFVQVVVDRYRGNRSVAAYEIWNEPNLQMFWNDTTENFLRMVIPAVKIIRQEDPDALVCFSGTSNLKDKFHDKNSQEYYDYIFSLNASTSFELHGQLNFDVVNIHPYSTSERDFEQILHDVQGVCEKWGFDWGHKGQMWITEFGWASPPEATTLLNEDASRTVKCITIGQNEGIRKCIIYRWKSYEDYYGLLWNNDSVKPTFNALLQAAPLLAQCTPMHEQLSNLLSIMQNTYHIYGFKKVNESRYVIVMWCDDNHRVSLSIAVDRSVFQHSETRVLLQGNRDSTNEWINVKSKVALEHFQLSNTPVFLVIDSQSPLSVIDINLDWDAAGVLTLVIVPVMIVLGIMGIGVIQKRKNKNMSESIP